MSNFSLEELRSLIKENLEQSIPSLKEQEAPEPPKEGLLELQKIAKLQRTFTPSEKASALNQLGIAGSKDPWKIVQDLGTKISTLSELKAACPDDLIKNVFLIASMADLLYSERVGQFQGWFMEEWLAQVTGGEVVQPADSVGTEDIVVGNKGYSIKLTQDKAIKGSVSELLFGHGYGAFVSPSNPGVLFFAEIPGLPSIETDYIHFLRSDDEVDVYNLKDEVLMQSVKSRGKVVEPPEDLKGWTRLGSNPAKTMKELPEGIDKVFAIAKDEAGKGIYKDVRQGSEGPVTIKIDLQNKINLANEEAQQAFERFKAIAAAFDEMTKDLSRFYAQPGPSEKSEAIAKSVGVGEAVEAYEACK